VITPAARHVIGAAQAFELAGITYRQLDYWARRGWVSPSVEAGSGRPGRRLYSPADVIRLAALGHFGRSGVDVGQVGPEMASLTVPETGDHLVVLGPGLDVEVVSASELRAHVAVPGTYVVFDPARLYLQMGLGPPVTAQSTLKEARTA